MYTYKLDISYKHLYTYFHIYIHLDIGSLPLYSIPITTQTSSTNARTNVLTSMSPHVSTSHSLPYSHKLRVVNVSQRGLLVTAVSNLKSQCFLFADEQCTLPVVESPLPSSLNNLEATLVVYVVIRPSSLFNLPSSTSSSNLQDKVRIYVYMYMRNYHHLHYHHLHYHHLHYHHHRYSTSPPLLPPLTFRRRYVYMYM
jgi:hypothetical protein